MAKPKATSVPSVRSSKVRNTPEAVQLLQEWCHLFWTNPFATGVAMRCTQRKPHEKASRRYDVPETYEDLW